LTKIHVDFDGEDIIALYQPTEEVKDEKITHDFAFGLVALFYF
jgi:hypothetical protein